MWPRRRGADRAATSRLDLDARCRRQPARPHGAPALSLASLAPTLADFQTQVIIRGTKAFIDGQNKDYSDLEVLQMIGRAGRPQFDTTGIGTSLCVLTAGKEGSTDTRMFEQPAS